MADSQAYTLCNPAKTGDIFPMPSLCNKDTIAAYIDFPFSSHAGKTREASHKCLKKKK